MVLIVCSVVFFVVLPFKEIPVLGLSNVYRACLAVLVVRVLLSDFISERGLKGMFAETE